MLGYWFNTIILCVQSVCSIKDGAFGNLFYRAMYEPVCCLLRRVDGRELVLAGLNSSNIFGCTCVQRQGWTCGHEIPGTQEDSWRQRASPRYTNGLEDRGLGVQDDPWVQRTSSRYPNGLKDRGLVRGWRVGLGNPSLEKADILVAL